jgi:hypothetical protein
MDRDQLCAAGTGPCIGPPLSRHDADRHPGNGCWRGPAHIGVLASRQALLKIEYGASRGPPNHSRSFEGLRCAITHVRVGNRRHRPCASVRCPGRQMRAAASRPDYAQSSGHFAWRRLSYAGSRPYKHPRTHPVSSVWFSASPCILALQTRRCPSLPPPSVLACSGRLQKQSRRVLARATAKPTDVRAGSVPP